MDNGHTRQDVVELGDAGLDTEVNGLVTEVNDDASKDSGVNLFKISIAHSESNALSW